MIKKNTKLRLKMARIAANRVILTLLLLTSLHHGFVLAFISRSTLYMGNGDSQIDNYDEDKVKISTSKTSLSISTSPSPLGKLRIFYMLKIIEMRDPH